MHASDRFATASVSALAATPDFSHLAALVDHAKVVFASAPSAPAAHATAPLEPLPTTLSAPSLTAIAHPDPSVLYTADARGALTRYALGPSGNPPAKRFAIPAAHSGADLTAVAARAADTPVLSAAKDGSIRAWDAATAQCTARLTGHRYDVRALALASSSDDAGAPVTVVASAGRDRTVRLWDVRAAGASAQLHVFKGHAGWVHAVSLAAGSCAPVAVSASGDRTVRVWDLRAMALRATLAGHEYRVWGVDVCADASLAVSASTDATVRAWDLRALSDDPDSARACQKRAVAFEPHSDAVLAVALHPSGSYFVSAAEDGSVVATGTRGLFGGGAGNDDDAVALSDSAHSPIPMTAAATPPHTAQAAASDAPLISLDESDAPGSALATPRSRSRPSSGVSSPRAPRALDTRPLTAEVLAPQARHTPTHPTTPELRAASTAGPDSEPGFDKSAAQLVGALRRVRDLESGLAASEQRASAAEASVAELRAALASRDAELAALRAEADDARGLARSAHVRALLRDSPRKADVSRDYEEPVNKIGAVSDQLSALAARLDAMIATK